MVAAGVSLFLLVACAHPSRVTSFNQGAHNGSSIGRIAVDPATNSLAPLIAQGLEHEGYVIDDPLTSVKLLAAHHLGRDSFETPEGRKALASERVDALLFAVPKSSGVLLETVSVRLVRAVSGDTVVAFVLETGGCGMPGSPCDARTKLSAYEAAGRIAETIRQSVGPGPDQLIETARDDATLEMSGVVFKKTGDCPGFAPGQRARFTVRGPGGPCARPLLILVRSGEQCEVEREGRPEWCERSGR